jgi:hypothetical protein
VRPINRRKHCKILRASNLAGLERFVWFRPVRAQAVDNLKEKWRRRGASNKGAIGATVKIANPNREHVMIENPDRPGIAKSCEVPVFQ